MEIFFPVAAVLLLHFVSFSGHCTAVVFVHDRHHTRQLASLHEYQDISTEMYVGKKGFQEIPFRKRKMEENKKQRTHLSSINNKHSRTYFRQDFAFTSFHTFFFLFSVSFSSLSIRILLFRRTYVTNSLRCEVVNENHSNSVITPSIYSSNCRGNCNFYIPTLCVEKWTSNWELVMFIYNEFYTISVKWQQLQ